jgi:hypothetical protein
MSLVSEMQPAILNRKERRRLAAQVRQPARPTCACCQTSAPHDGDHERRGALGDP